MNKVLIIQPCKHNKLINYTDSEVYWAAMECIACDRYYFFNFLTRQLIFEEPKGVGWYRVRK